MLVVVRTTNRTDDPLDVVWCLRNVCMIAPFLGSILKPADATGRAPADVTGRAPADVTGTTPADVTGRAPAVVDRSAYDGGREPATQPPPSPMLLPLMPSQPVAGLARTCREFWLFIFTCMMPVGDDAIFAEDAAVPQRTSNGRPANREDFQAIKDRFGGRGIKRKSHFASLVCQLCFSTTRKEAPRKPQG
jgi:hypothetical protein